MKECKKSSLNFACNLIILINYLKGNFIYNPWFMFYLNSATCKQIKKDLHLALHNMECHPGQILSNKYKWFDFKSKFVDSDLTLNVSLLTLGTNHLALPFVQKNFDSNSFFRNWEIN